jgi:hypothetical protein
LVVALLKNGSYTDVVGRRLYGLAAELGRLAGWEAYDSGDEALAQRYWMAALRNAHISGDRAIVFVDVPSVLRQFLGHGESGRIEVEVDPARPVGFQNSTGRR